jgi:hypothetical protein
MVQTDDKGVDEGVSDAIDESIDETKGQVAEEIKSEPEPKHITRRTKEGGRKAKMNCRHCGKDIHEEYNGMPESYTDENGKLVTIPEYAASDYSSCRKGYGHAPISDEELVERTINEQKRAYEAYKLLLRGIENGRHNLEYSNYNDNYNEEGFGITGCAWDCLCSECVRRKLNSKLFTAQIICPKCGKEATKTHILGWKYDKQQTCIDIGHGEEMREVDDFFGGKRKYIYRIRCFGDEKDTDTIIKALFEKEDEKLK